MIEKAIFANNHLLLSKGYDNPLPHRHLAKHLIFGLKNEFSCIIENQEMNCSGICIDSDVEHTVTSNDELLVFLFDETSSLSKKLDDQFLIGNKYRIIDGSILLQVREIWKAGDADARQLDHDILFAFHLDQAHPEIYDRRISILLEVINHLDRIDDCTLNMLCKTVFLSQSRLSHLFKEQVRVSLNSFLVFEKMRKTYAYIEVGENITTACIHAGFSSSSHFAATCKKMFGISFTEFSKEAVFLQLNS